MISPSGVEFFGFDTMSENDWVLPVESFWVDPSRRQQALDIIRTKGRVSDFEIRLKRKDGTKSFMLQSHSICIVMMLGECAGNRRHNPRYYRAQRPMRNSKKVKAILESLINATTETLLLVDLEGNILVAKRNRCPTIR